MLPKSQTISVRLPQEDVDFLANFKANGATTQSEKLREIIRLVREQSDHRHSLAKGIAANSAYLSELKGAVKEIELQEGIYSEIVESFFAILPDLNAIASQHQRFESVGELRELEVILGRRFGQFLDRLLRLATTETSPCYNAKVMSEQMQKLKPLLVATLNNIDQQGEEA